MMITATSPLYTVFFARLFIKEPIFKVDILNVFFVGIGIILIAKPPFIFGKSILYFQDMEATYALAALIASAILLGPNIFITLRLVKHLGKAICLHYEK